jgi:DtxR family Mn-dependent transcriptional regulator
MLGHPAVDPHGDPIPDSDGVIHMPDLATLLTCATNQPLRVSRVVDQDAAFLRFIEQSHLKPGQPVLVEERDTAADRVTVRTNGASLALGQRAASKVLVEPEP